MKTRILLIGLIIFLVNVISVNARETILICSDNYVNKKGQNIFSFPKGGGKPFGNDVELVLFTTNKLDLEIKAIQVKNYKECFPKMFNGTVDIMVGYEKSEERSKHIIFVPIKREKDMYSFLISKKSKFASRVDDFKKSLPSVDEVIQIYITKFTSSYDHYFSEDEENLGKLYSVYAKLKSCHEARKGYQSVYVSTHDMTKIKEMTKSTETLIFEKAPKIKDRSDGIWDRRTRVIPEVEVVQMQIDGQPVIGITKVSSQWDVSNKKTCDLMIFYLETLVTGIVKKMGGTVEKKSDKDF